MNDEKSYRRLRMHDNESTLLNLLAQLDQKYPRLVIVVEGIRDENVLRNAGVGAEILRIHTGESIASVVREIVKRFRKGNQVLLLTDFDEEGKALAHRIERALESEHVTTLKGLRLRIRSLMGNLRCIEEIVSLLKKQEWRDRD